MNVSALWFEAHAAERLAAEEVQLEALHLFGNRGEPFHIGEHHPGDVVVVNLLRRLVELRPLSRVGDYVGLLDQVAELLVTPVRDVVAAGNGVASGPDYELARIRIVPGS